MPIKLEHAECCIESDEYEPRYVCINIPTDAKTAIDLELDDTIEVVIKGKVKAVHASKEKDPWGAPGDVRVEVDEVLIEGKNAFAELAGER